MATPEELLQRRLAREISARQQAETLLEQKSLELYIEAQERQVTLLKLQESKERYRQIVEMSPDAILVELDGSLIFANTAARRMFAENGGRQLIGLSLIDLGLQADVARATEHPTERIETIAIRLDGSRFEIALRCMPMLHQGKGAMQIAARDISDRKRLERELAHQAAHDSLTGVNNRRALIASLAETLALARRHNLRFWVVFIDLDHFKQINDRFGHRAGDRVLETITARLRNLLRADDIIGRYGGDEFVLLLRGGPDSRLATPLLDRIMQVVCEPVVFEGHSLQVTCSLGITAYPDDGDTEDSLIERADAAMYLAKQSGRNLYQLYNADIQLQATERNLIQSGLVAAVQNGELFLLYQPQIDLSTGAVVGVEALLRWQHPILGTLKPARFMPIAQESRLIDQVGAWVIHMACQHGATLARLGLGELSISVNLSAKELHAPQIIETVRQALAESGLPPGALELELTECMIMENIGQSIDTLNALSALGVKLAIDNFGTGYSSLPQLHRLPISTLKIDRQFIAAIEASDQQDVPATISAMIQLAHGFGIWVLAEGVETPKQFSLLRKQSCDLMQGWLHSSAMPFDELVGLLRDYDPQAWLRSIT
jgi:diguanylate cyclase (GGDEF)-like protein/PAS domain S-box-containing protein